MEYIHKPVLLDECIAMLNIRPDGVYIDGTLGRAGHSKEIARRLTTGRLVCIDQDLAAIRAAEELLAPWRDRVTLVHGNFSDLADILRRAEISGADGALFDLGVSSPQLDDASRGFSYMQDAPLDMRMDGTAALTAREVVNTWSCEELRRILYEYGEERYAPAIARAIVRTREERPVETTLELVEIIRGAMPPAGLREKQHPAKRSFQAIRIAVNGELDVLPPMLKAAVEGLNPGGRLAVITFHSLEDRIVKRTMQDLARGCTCPREFPVCVCGKKPKIRLVTRKPIVPGEAELAENPGPGALSSGRRRSARCLICNPACDGTGCSRSFAERGNLSWRRQRKTCVTAAAGPCPWTAIWPGVWTLRSGSGSCAMLERFPAAGRQSGKSPRCTALPRSGCGRRSTCPFWPWQALWRRRYWRCWC